MPLFLIVTSQEIICDADLHHLGMPDMVKKSELLRRELDSKGIKKTNEVEWLKISFDFINNHNFFTASAEKVYGPQKKINQKKIEEKLKSIHSEK